MLVSMGLANSSEGITFNMLAANVAGNHVTIAPVAKGSLSFRR
jgi:hypothetical protein